MKTLYMISGPSGSGKTTFASKIREEKGVEFNFEADQWMKNQSGEYCFDPRHLGYCHQQCQEHTENIMKSGKDVIVSNTSLTIKEAKPYIN
jgi:uridine kinase